MIVEYAKERGEREEKRAVRPSGEFRVMVEGLPARTSWQDLKDHMKQPAEVGFCDVTDGGTKGWAEYRSLEDMERAIRELDGSTYKGERITCFREGSAPAAGSSDRPRSRSRSRSPERKRSRSRSHSHSRSRSRSPSPKKARDHSPDGRD